MLDYRPAQNLLADRCILITGATGGLGRAAALACARHGAQVILLGRDVPKLEALYDEIESLGAPAPAILPMELLQASDALCHDIATTVEEQVGRLDGILHNAAELGALAPIELYHAEIWTRVFQVNVHAPFLLTRALLPLLKRAPDASVVFTSAEVGRRPRAYWGAYAAAYGAVEVMAQTLALELDNTAVRVNTLDPGNVQTALRTRAYPAEDPQQWPLPEEVMPAYLYLLGPDSRGVTGQALAAQRLGPRPTASSR